MKQIIDWLRKIERSASQLYSEVSEIFEENEVMRRFMRRLAEDEAMHFHVINSADVCLKMSPSDIESDLVIDEETKSNVEQPFRVLKQAMAENRLTIQKTLECVGDAEHSEWNEIFLYVINCMKTTCKEFVYVGPKLQHHLRFIENYFDENEALGGAIMKINKIEPVWNENILVVDDSGPIVELLQAVLRKDGVVHTAGNGKEALDMALQQYYSVILSDINMPIMDGLEFFRKLERKYGNISHRFLFMTGDPSEKVLDFIKEKNIRLIPKPFTLAKIRRVIFEIMENSLSGTPARKISMG